MPKAARTANAEARKALYALAMERGRWAVQSEQAATMGAGLKLAKHALLLEHEAINPDPWLFNCRNGTLDLRTGQLQSHAPADLITHLAPVIYDPDATCPTWEQFLLEVFAADPAMVAFIQRAIGWCLTGVVQERAIFLLYGAQGHNGKTTLVEVVRDLLGTFGEEGFGYARKVDVMTFMKSKNYEDNLRKAAQLAGARFVYSSEIDEEHRLNEQLIKDMTRGDTMEARRLYKEAFNFKPTFKPWMYGNHKPEIRGTDDAIWDRVKLVRVSCQFCRSGGSRPAHQTAQGTVWHPELGNTGMSGVATGGAQSPCEGPGCGRGLPQRARYHWPIHQRALPDRRRLYAVQSRGPVRSLWHMVRGQ